MHAEFSGSNSNSNSNLNPDETISEVCKPPEEQIAGSTVFSPNLALVTEEYSDTSNEPPSSDTSNDLKSSDTSNEPPSSDSGNEPKISDSKN
jgi:hypothetical protein